MKRRSRVQAVRPDVVIYRDNEADLATLRSDRSDIRTASSSPDFEIVDIDPSDPTGYELTALADIMAQDTTRL